MLHLSSMCNHKKVGDKILKKDTKTKNNKENFSSYFGPWQCPQEYEFFDWSQTAQFLHTLREHTEHDTGALMTPFSPFVLLGSFLLHRTQWVLLPSDLTLPVKFVDRSLFLPPTRPSFSKRLKNLRKRNKFRFTFHSQMCCGLSPIFIF